MWDKTSPQFGFPAFGLDPFQANQLVELQLRVSQQEQNLNRLQAQRIELDAEVRMLREELQQVRGQGSHVGGVAKAMDKEEVFVGVHPDGISVVDDIERCDEEIREPESELSEDVQSEDEQSDEYLSARSELSDSETSERGEPMNDLNDKCSTAETEPSEDKPKKKKSFIFTKAVSALAVGATVTSVALFPATWPVVALNGARVIFATKSIEDNPVTGTIGTVATLALECMIPCASSAKYLVQTGKSIHRVSDLSKVAYGTKLLIQSGKSIHRVGPVARYGWNVASYTSQAITSVVARLKAKSKSKSEKQEKN